MGEQTVPFNPVELQLGATAYYVSPGSRQEIPFALINRTGRDDYFDISIRGIPSEWLQLDFPVLQVGANERREASFTIAAPEGAEGAFPAVLRAASQAYEDRASEVVFDLRVVAYEPTRSGESMAQEAASGRVGLRMETTQYHVVPGASVAIQALIINQGLTEDTFQLTVDGLPISWVSTPTPALRLMAGEQRELTLFVQPPQTPSSRAGRYPFHLQLASQTEPGQLITTEGVLTLAAFSQFTSDLTPRHLDAGQTARLRIQNLGNIPSNYAVTWQNPNDDLEFVPSQSGPFQVEPGEMVSVDFAVSTRTPNWLSSPMTLPYTVVIHSSEGDAQAHNGEVFSRALIPVWVLPAMMVLCLTIVCGMGFLWNWNQDRITQATTTARQQIAAVEEATATAAYNQTAAALQGQEDTDGDGLTNAQEQQAGTNGQSPDSDNDRMLDGDEVRLGVNPLNPDTDGDGILDGPDLNPLDVNNPALTATAQSGVPVATMTPQPTLAPPTLTFTPSAAATIAPLPTSTNTPSGGNPQPPPVVLPTATFTNPAPQATPTATVAATIPPVVEATATGEPLPVTGLSPFIFESNRNGDNDIYQILPTQDEPVPLTESPGNDSQPVWSPDGSRIAFTSERDGNNDIFVMNADGSSPTNMTSHPSDDAFPAWSPDGSAIVFTTNRDGNQEIYQVDLDGSNLVNLTDHPANDTTPVIYVDRSLLSSTERLVFTTDRDGNNEIYVMNASGEAEEEVVNLTNSPANDALPAVLPEGGPILFVSDRAGNADVFVMDENGDNPTNLTNHPATDTYPSWGADGEQISFTTDRDGNAEVYVMEVNGENPANLTADPAQDQNADLQ